VLHAISGLHRDPAAVDFFQQYFPWLTRMLGDDLRLFVRQALEP